MKRIFTFTVLMLAFAMNAVAWEPVIKEKHWFGMHEFYSAPILGVTTTDITGAYIKNKDLNGLKEVTKVIAVGDTVKMNMPNDWTDNGTYYGGCGIGKIGTCTVDYKWHQADQRASLSLLTSQPDNTHTENDFCIGVEARWDNQRMSFSQEVLLPKGNYTLSFDVQNVNPNTNSTTFSDYEDLFYVQVGNANPVKESNPSWINYNNGAWSTHTLSFYTDGTQNVKISLGYGIKQGAGLGTNNYAQGNTPELYVSHLKLEQNGESDAMSKINWSGNYIESITVIKDWTGQVPLQQPKTSFYSWLDHQLRFSVNVIGNWGLGRNDNTTYKYGNDHGLGLKNTSNGATNFLIHNLKNGDKFNIEYYRTNGDTNVPFLVSGSVVGLVTGDHKILEKDDNNVITQTNVVYGTDTNGPVYYEMSADGNVEINIPSGTVIRSVTIQHAQYKKATAEVTELTTNEVDALTNWANLGHIETKGYRYKVTGSGVLEDKRGAVPYITMRFGADNDMTFVRKVGDGIFAASNIIDKSNNFVPGTPNPGDDNTSTAQLQLPYRSMTEDHLKYWLAEKEWSVFTTKLTTNDEGHTVEDFSTIYPLYGSYYYFFPEVRGILKMRFYCEGNEETPAFWYKQQEVNGVTTIRDYSPEVKKEGLNTNYRTSGGNYYDYTVQVEKGGVYYLCSLPTNINHEHPIIRLISYEFVPTFRIAPLYEVVDNGATYVDNVAQVYGGVFSDLADNETTGEVDINKKITINADPNALKVKFLGNVESATPYFVVEDKGTENEKQYLCFKDIVYKNSTGVNDNEGGAIVVNLECSAGKATFVLTVAYSAENKNDNGTPVSTQVKKWDFYSTPLAIGQYKNNNGGLYDPQNPSNYLANSQLYREVHKADGLTADWSNTYMDIVNSREPIFKSVYDMEGDNADMLEETAGLVFLTHANQLGIYNENDAPSGSFQDRYVGLMKGGELTIPKLKDGDRIVIKMGRSILDNGMTLTVGGAKDAVGRAINTDYKIGGSFNDGHWSEKENPHVEYHFIKDGNGDFTLEVKDATLLKLYTIEIYRYEDRTETPVRDKGIYTENTLLGDNREILYTDRDGGLKRKIDTYLHYYGAGETQAYLGASHKTGSFASIETISFDQTENHFTYTPAHNDFGTFRVRVGNKTTDDGKTYVTDYADYQMAVGYRETKSYPYTWDFTDLKKYAKTTLDANGDEVIGTVKDGLGQTLSDNAKNDLKIWDDYGLRVRAEECQNGCLFVSGSQLYSGTTMFDESKGIGIAHYNNDTKRNRVMTMTGDSNGENGGLSVVDNLATSEDSPKRYEFIVPAVKEKQAVYVHAKEAGAFHSAKYSLDINCLDLTDVTEGKIPESWTCIDGIDVHNGNNTYDSGSRVFYEMLNNNVKALHWRNTQAIFGYKIKNDSPVNTLYLTSGTYELYFTMAAWKEEPKYKVAIYSPATYEDVAVSEELTATPYAKIGDEPTIYDVSGAKRHVLKFVISTAGYYYINFTDETKTEGNHEFLLLECRLKSPEQDFTYSAADQNGNGGKVFAMSLPENATESDVRLCFQGYEVNKIAVSTEQEHKNLNVKGWATESRDHDIDASLTSYMTGKDIKTYIVTTVNSKDRYATLTDVSDKRMPLANDDGSSNACILFNNTDKGPLDIYGNGTGFHLFVPDMHDTEKETPVTGNNLLKAKLTPGEMSVGTGNTVNYVFTYQYVKINPETGVVISGERENDEMAFYRLGTQRTVTSIGNQAYLPVSTSDASRSVLFYLNYAGGESDPTVIDALLPTEPKEAAEPLRYYNLNGQQLDSKPNRSGLYIVNGKKKYIKIK